MPDAVRLVELHVAPHGDQLQVTWRVSGPVAAPLPTRPPTFGFAWAVFFDDGSRSYAFTVKKSRDGVFTSRSARKLGEISKPPVDRRRAGNAGFHGNVVTLRLSEADFPDWSGHRLRWSGSTSWDRHDVTDTCSTDVVLLAASADEVLSRPELPLPSRVEDLTFIDGPRAHWRGSADLPLSDALAKVERELGDGGFAVSNERQSVDDRGPITHHTTSVYYSRGSASGTISLIEVRVRDIPVEVVLMIAPTD